MKRAAAVFGIFFVFSLIVQMLIWSMDSFTDEQLWIGRLNRMAEDVADGSFDQKNYSGHPGTSILLLGAAVKYLGVRDSISLNISVAFLVSLALGGAMAALSLFPVTAWALLGAGSTAVLHPLFVQASPANAVVSAWLMFILITGLWLSAARRAAPGLWIIWGGSIGLALTAHFSLTLLTAGGLGIFLLAKKGLKYISFSASTALAVWILLDPLLWQAPYLHLGYMLGRIRLHTFELSGGYLQLSDFFLFAPLALFSWAVIVLSLRWRQMASFLPRTERLFMVCLTLLVSMILLRSASQSIRYFFPLILFWEMILPVWLLDLARQTRYPTTLSGLSIGLIVAGQSFLLFRALT